MSFRIFARFSSPKSDQDPHMQCIITELTMLVYIVRRVYICSTRNCICGQGTSSFHIREFKVVYKFCPIKLT